MLDTAAITEKAKTSKFYLRLLNLGLNKMIPFNKPHEETFGYKLRDAYRGLVQSAEAVIVDYV